MSKTPKRARDSKRWTDLGSERVRIDREGIFRGHGGAEVLYLPLPKDGVAQCTVYSRESGAEVLFTSKKVLLQLLVEHFEACGVSGAPIIARELAEYSFDDVLQASEPYLKPAGTRSAALDAVAAYGTLVDL